MKEFNLHAQEVLKISDIRRETAEIFVRLDAGNVPGVKNKGEHKSSPHLRCETCDWCAATGGSSFADTSGVKDDETRTSGKGQETPSRVTLRHDGRAICNVCWRETQQTKYELFLLSGETLDFRHDMDRDSKLLTGEQIHVTLRQKVREPNHTYLDVIGGEVVEVGVYPSTHGKLKNNFTEEEKERWREEYTKSLGPKSTVPSLSDGRSG